MKDDYSAVLELAAILSEVKVPKSTPLPTKDPVKPLEFGAYGRAHSAAPSAVALNIGRLTGNVLAELSFSRQPR